MYAIIDIETTGGNSDSDRITEIALFLHDGEKVTGSWSTLVNPERRIPYRIQMMTGITDEMVANAPKFYEVARQLVEMTEDRVFVAHNVGFDYNFVRNEFSRLAFPYKRKKLCTVKLAKKLIPGLPSYSLPKLAPRLGIEIKVQHRAEPDARATVELFEMLLAKDRYKKEDAENEDFSSLELNRNIDPKVIEHLPRTAGVYYFFNSRKELIYIGKSVDIRSRVLSHFANCSTAKAMEMKNHIAFIEYEETGSELIALLKESEEIKRHKPYYNRALRRESFNIGLFYETDKKGYIRFKTRRLNDKSKLPVTTFSSNHSARGFLERLTAEFELCQKLTGIFKAGQGACFKYHIQECNGACVGQESPEDYNVKVKEALKSISYDHENLIILDRGRTENEWSVVAIENGRYLGFGFTKDEIREPQWLKQCVAPARDNRDVQTIIRGYLSRNEVEELIVF